MPDSAPRRAVDPLALGIAFVYLFASALARYITSPTLDLDQAEQSLLSQQFAWGYSEQPPLYTWLVQLMFSLTGPAAWALFALKAAVLWLTAAALIVAAAGAGLPAARQRVILVGLALIPQYIWESQRDVTHSTLATALAAVTLALLLQVRRQPSRGGLLALGLALAAGLLSKYNFALLLPAVLLALHGPAPGRVPLVQGWPWLLGLLLLAGPHAWWAFTHPELQARGVAKLAAGEGALWSALGTTALNALAFATPLWLLALGTTGPGDSPATRILDREAKWLLVVLAITVALLVILGSTRGFKDRWFQPLLIWIALWYACRARVTGRVWRWTVIVTAVLALTVSAALVARVAAARALNEALRPNLPYAKLAAAMGGTLAQPPEVILAERKLLGGNLRMHWPDARVITPEVAAALARPGPGRWLVVCETADCGYHDFRAWVKGYSGVSPDLHQAASVSAGQWYWPERRHAFTYLPIDVP